MKHETIGFAMCGSFCTFERSFDALKTLRHSYENVIPIVSEAAGREDTRFGSAKAHMERIRALTGEAIFQR